MWSAAGRLTLFLRSFTSTSEKVADKTVWFFWDLHVHAAFPRNRLDRQLFYNKKLAKVTVLGAQVIKRPIMKVQ